jgi:hypothetical protein
MLVLRYGTDMEVRRRESAANRVTGEAAGCGEWTARSGGAAAARCARPSPVEGGCTGAHGRRLGAGAPGPSLRIPGLLPACSATVLFSGAAALRPLPRGRPLP